MCTYQHIQTMSTFSLVLNKRITVVRRRFAPRRRVSAAGDWGVGFSAANFEYSGLLGFAEYCISFTTVFCPMSGFNVCCIHKSTLRGQPFLLYHSTYLYTRAFKTRLFEYRLPKPKPRPPFTRHATTERRHGNRSPCRYVN